MPAATTATTANAPCPPPPTNSCRQAYVSYKVITRTTAAGYRDQAEVIRRFRDFTWLQKRLRHEFRGKWAGVYVAGPHL